MCVHMPSKIEQNHISRGRTMYTCTRTHTTSVSGMQYKQGQQTHKIYMYMYVCMPSRQDTPAFASRSKHLF